MTIVAGIALTNFARLFAACLLTMGVSSWTKAAKCCLSLSCEGGVALAYGTLYSPVADILDVNQSAFESRVVRGIKYSSTCCWDSCSHILFKDSTALKEISLCKLDLRTYHLTFSLTSGSSIAARFSKGDKSTCA